MKKIALVILALALLTIGSASLAACGSKATTSNTIVSTTAATTPATTTTSATTTTTTPTPTPVTISLTAQNMAFDKSTITVKAGASVTINFNNMDSGIPHNFSLYQTGSASGTATGVIFQGQLVTGPKTITYTFTAPATPGTYFFRCDVHPTTMTGSFIVTA